MDIEEVRRTGGRDKKGKEMVVVRLQNEDKKKKIMEGKRKLRNRKAWMEKDLTWKERRAKWLLRRKAERLRAEERKIGIGYENVNRRKRMDLE